jgi:hypothetical protein
MRSSASGSETVDLRRVTVYIYSIKAFDALLLRDQFWSITDAAYENRSVCLPGCQMSFRQFWF